jgi:hypothetical protein
MTSDTTFTTGNNDDGKVIIISQAHLGCLPSDMGSLCTHSNTHIGILQCGQEGGASLNVMMVVHQQCLVPHE